MKSLQQNHRLRKLKKTLRANSENVLFRDVKCAVICKHSICNVDLKNEEKHCLSVFMHGRRQTPFPVNSSTKNIRTSTS